VTDRQLASLILKYEPMVRSIVRSLAHAGFNKADIDEIRQNGRMGLVIAAKRYDRTRHKTFSLFAKKCVTHFVQQEITKKSARRRERTWGGDLPELVADPVAAALVDEAQALIEQMTELESRVIRSYFGMSNGGKSHQAVARAEGITEYRVRVIIDKFRLKLFERLGIRG
jgi:RNA polymerase sigma factor (sigma-70 family)